MFRKVLIANRGEIALRIGRTLRRMGVASVAVYSDADRFTAPVLAADEAFAIGASPAAESYLRIDAIIDACRATGAEAVHPGYGFLSERAAFVDALTAAGIRFIGPRAEHLRAFGLKHAARALAEQAGVPMLPGSGLLSDLDQAVAQAAMIGFPVMLKSTAGGGGIGMQLCRDVSELIERFETIRRQGANSFGDARVYLEKFVSRARHVEVQVFGDGRGGVVILGERDCSLQRRNQKVIEETPAPNLSDVTRERLHNASRMLAQSVAYESAGTVEFVYDADLEQFYFLEVNTRLQVEHCVTESVFGIDLVEWMVRQAAGGFVLPPQESLRSQGAAIEARVYAENAAQDFRPSTGLLTEVRFAPGVRVDGWIETGTVITPYYDPLLAKIIAHGNDRPAAIARLKEAVDGSVIFGLESNLSYLSAILAAPAFHDATMTTATLATLPFAPRSIEVLAAGTQSSVQDFPGRIGFWDVGVPPSGPMDDRSHRVANCIVGNRARAATLEMTLTGATLRFNARSVIALAGAKMRADLDNMPVTLNEAITVQAGQTLRLGAIQGAGMRCYLAVRGGIDAPLYLGSRATFALGGFGGHATGCLRTGDVLRIGDDPGCVTEIVPPPLAPLTTDWQIGVTYGPHGAPDFFDPADIADLFSATYEVHYNSARTGIRLIGPKPRWARPDGGEAGLHPSNIHDNAYAIGSIDFTGDMPILLGPDGPSLGGFVCPAVVVSDELWKLGQLRPGDHVTFERRIPPRLALRGVAAMHRDAPEDPVLLREEGDIPVVYRRDGDQNLLVEFGPPVLDIRLRLRAQLLLDAVREASLPGLIDLTPGIRSLQLHYDPAVSSMSGLVDALRQIERDLPHDGSVRVPSRIVHLPLSWDDAQAQLAMSRYQELVRPDAPWCPSNIEFIRRINGLASTADVRKIVFDASYLVLGLGDVYLGAPVATPVDPRHRLVTTKYNPARTWTPENAVGIGGSYLCIYGMEGPGGYQLLGRTVQVWNSWRRTDVFAPQKPWLLRFFDQIRFYPVSPTELQEARAAFPHGRYPLRIEETSFSLREHQDFINANEVGIATARTRQQAAFEVERQDWVARGLDNFVEDMGGDLVECPSMPESCVALESPVPGNVWKVLVAEGDTVRHGDPCIIIESMKTEMTLPSPASGTVRELLCRPGREVRGGQRVLIIQT